MRRIGIVNRVVAVIQWYDNFLQSGCVVRMNFDVSRVCFIGRITLQIIYKLYALPIE